MALFEFIADTPIDRLREQLSWHPELWDVNNRRRVSPGSPHSRMSDIWLRYNDSAPFEKSGDWSKFNDRHVPINYPAWSVLSELAEISLALMHRVEGEMLGGVLITRIPHGMGIDPHADHGWHVDYYDKFYLSIESAPGAQFIANDTTDSQILEPKPGEIWRFDNRNTHSVVNNSGQDRVTAIICIRTHMFQKHQSQ